jgi:hypothetical protein
MIIQLPSNTLRPSWQPFSPFVSSPPELPEKLHPGSVLLMPTTSSVVRKKIQPSPSLSSLHLSPCKPQRQIPQKDRTGEQGKEELQVPEFGTLSRYDGSHCDQPQDLVIWHRPGVFDMDVSGPQHMYGSPVKDAPLSILYEVFAKRFDELEREHHIA